MEKLDLQRFAQEEENAVEEALRQEDMEDESQETGEAEKPTFRQMIEGPWRKEYEDAVGQRVQAAIQQRFRNQADWRKQAEELLPLAKALGEKYGLEATDVGAITERMKAEQARSDGSAEEQAYQRHFLSLARQAEEMKRTFPDFDLRSEMRDAAFVRMTAPGTGMTVKDAYYALHGDRIRLQSMRFAAWQAGEKLASSVLSGASRPVENGMEKPAAADLSMDIQNMDKQSREAYRRRIRNGEIIDFVKNI